MVWKCPAPRKIIINDPTAEMLAREIKACFVSFDSVRNADDWRKPIGAPKSWTSKVDWESYDRIYPRARPAALSDYPELADEVRAARTNDATFDNARQRSTLKPKDRLSFAG